MRGIGAQLKMATHLGTWYCEEVRSVVRFLSAKHASASEIHRQLIEVGGNNAVNRENVTKWCVLFADGTVDVRDDGGEAVRGRPRRSAVLHELMN
jgi:hypothetical protein